MLALAAVLMTVSFATSAGAAEQGVTKDEILVGSVGVMTGPYYIYGKLTMNGLDAVFDKVNEAGGVHGRKLRLVREDDFCKPEGAIAAVKKLIYDHKVFAIIGGACSNATLAAKPEIVRAGIPFNVFAAVADGISSPPSPNIFTTTLTAAIESRSQLKWALDKGAKRIAIVAQHDAWGRSRYEPLIAAMKAKGMTPVADEEMTLDTNDATTHILKVMKGKADAVIMILYPKPGAVLVRDAIKLGYKPLWIGQTAINDWDNFEGQVGIKGSLKNFFTITAVLYQPNDPEMKEWTGRIKKLFPNDNLSVFNQLGIGAAQVFVEALKRAGPNPTRASYLKAMGSIKGFKTDVHPGPITCNPPKSHQCNQSPAWLGEVDGKVKLIGVTTLN
jgi:branched-chain amino acid transport system substrate-binding protein